MAMLDGRARIIWGEPTDNENISIIKRAWEISDKGQHSHFFSKIVNRCHEKAEAVVRFFDGLERVDGIFLNCWHSWIAYESPDYILDVAPNNIGINEWATNIEAGHYVGLLYHKKPLISEIVLCEDVLMYLDVCLQIAAREYQ